MGRRRNRPGRRERLFKKLEKSDILGSAAVVPKIGRPPTPRCILRQPETLMVKLCLPKDELLHLRLLLLFGPGYDCKFTNKKKTYLTIVRFYF